MRMKALLIFSGWFFSSLTLSLTAQANEVDQQRMLAETLPKDGVIWLELDNEKSLAVYRRAAEKNSKGSVIVLKNSVDDVSVHAALLENLAEGLVKEGWHTLLVFMPASANASGQKRLEAAIAFLKKSEAKNVVVVMADKTAPLLTPLFSSKPSESPFQKLILLDAANTAGEFKQPFMEILDPQMRIFDALLGESPVNSPEYQGREQRNALAKQRQFSHYQKINSPRPSTLPDTDNSWIFKRILGWLDKP